MAVYYSHGRLINFQMDNSSGVLKDLSTYVMEVNGIPPEVDLGDVTTAGSTGHRFYPGLEKGTITVKFRYADGTDTPVDVIGTRASWQTDATMLRSFVFGPRGSTSGYPKYTGELMIKSCPMDAKATDPLVMTMTAELDNGVSEGTYPV